LDEIKDDDGVDCVDLTWNDPALKCIKNENCKTYLSIVIFDLQ